MNMQFRLAPCAELAASSKSEMHALFVEHFDGVSFAQFNRDLVEKDLALLLEREDRLVGFSTLLAYTTVFEGESINVIYSGDTIVSPDAWGTAALPRAWVAGVESLRLSLPSARCFWLLLTSGFRTYRFLPVFWREFFPRYDSSTPPEMQRMLNHLARERFGSQFENGIVRFSKPQQLRRALQKIPQGREQDPHVSFFLARNPGHARGDELVALTEISAENLTPAGRRMMRPHAPQSLHCQ
jgi:hypothetical protein